jgi:MYXO-CTERM domain-containing protein
MTFTFTDQSGVPLNSVITSNTITVEGITTTVAITVTGGEFSINGGTYTASAVMVSNGDTVSVRHTSSATNNRVVDTVLTLGGGSDTFSSTTLASAATSSSSGAFGLWFLVILLGTTLLRRRREW